MKYIYISLLLIILTLGIACNRSDHDTLEVYAASSLSDVLNELIEEYQKISPHDISISYAGSSTLRQQIQYGATPNIADYVNFIIDSSNIEWNREKVQKGKKYVKFFLNCKLVEI